MLKNYVSKIQELEGELLQLKNSNNRKHGFIDCADLDDDDDEFRSKNVLFPCSNEYSDYDCKIGAITGSYLKALFGFIDQGFIFSHT